MKKIIFVLFVCGVLFSSCTTEKIVIEVRTDTLYVYQLGQTDTVSIFRTDTVWSGENVKYVLRIDTLFRKVFVYRKADTLKIAYPDTVRIYQKEEKGFFSKLETVLYLTLAIILLGFLWRMFK